MTDNPLDYQVYPLLDNEIGMPEFVPQNQIMTYLQRYVVGQEEAIATLSYLGEAYTRKAQCIMNNIGLDKLPPLNCLVTGPTGYGKSYMLIKLAQAIGIPYKKISCSSLTAEEYIGPSLSEELNIFLKSTTKGVGILHLDEIDKMAQGDDETHLFRLQSNFLELLEHRYSGSHTARRDLAGTPLEDVNNALIVLSGSFQSDRNARDKKNSIGFVHPPKLRTSEWANGIKEFGILHELEARIMCHIELEEYTREEVESLIKGFGDTKYSVLSKYRWLFPNIKELTDETIGAMADEIMSSSDGLRKLDAIMFKHVFNEVRIDATKRVKK